MSVLTILQFRAELIVSIISGQNERFDNFCHFEPNCSFPSFRAEMSILSVFAHPVGLHKCLRQTLARPVGLHKFLRQTLARPVGLHKFLRQTLARPVS